MKIDNCNFVTAVKKLQEYKPQKLTLIIDKPQVLETIIKQAQYTELSNNNEDKFKIENLKKYATSRGISEHSLDAIGIEYIAQKNFYYLGLKNNSNVYVLRNFLYKGNAGNTDISFIKANNIKDNLITIVV